MKTNRTVSITVWIGTGMILTAQAHAASGPAPTPVVKPETEAKPYVLYMRTDVAVERDKKLYPIKDVHGQAFVINVKGQAEEVPMVGNSHRLEFKHALTLTRNSANLKDLVSERAYTVARDPKLRRQRDAVTAEATLGDNASLLEGKTIVAANNNFVAINGDARAPDGTPIHGTEGIAAAMQRNSSIYQNSDGGGPPSDAFKALQARNQAEDVRDSNITSGGFARLAAESDMALEQFDAVAVRFEVSSQTFLEKPYVVVITRFHARDDKPGVARNAVFAKALEGFGAKPVKVDILHGGFPLGFEIEELQVHLYNEGKEVPTDIAQKRVPLTREEAFQYLMIDYLRGHRTDTLPATPAVGRPDRMELSRLTPNQVKATYFVIVSKQGRPGGVFADEACSQPAEEPVAALAGAARYYPAIEQGKPVDGVARLVLTELSF